jgi:hypothetical protein
MKHGLCATLSRLPPAPLGTAVLLLKGLDLTRTFD